MNWNPIIAEADLLQDIKGYDLFISHQKREQIGILGQIQ